MDDSDEYEFEDYADDAMLEEEDMAEPPQQLHKLKSQSSVIYMQLKDITSMLNEKVADLREILSTSADDTLVLFHHYRWNRDQLENSGYFENQDKIRREAGLATSNMNSIPLKGKDFLCSICFETVNKEEASALTCNHYYCNACWQGYVTEKINDPTEGAFWRCPTPKCQIMVLDNFVRKHLSQSKITSYEKKLAMSYAEENKAIKWCPAPDCIYCVENPSLTSRAIHCRCGFVYCFKCGKEDHQPCDCRIVENWSLKNSSESENTRWIMVYTKICPKCRHPIEKNQGCNHMSCRHKGCGFEFCWLCLGDWKTHQGSHYKCNIFESLNEEQKKNQKQNVDREKSELERYIFYFERFNNHDKGLNVSKGLLKPMEDHMLELHDHLGIQHGELTFLSQAAHTLIQCKRVLKWSYAFGFYIFEDKKGLFEFGQKDLENYSDRLLEEIEINFSQSIKNQDGKYDLKCFSHYKSEVIALTQKCTKFLSGFLAQTDQSWANMKKL